MVMDENQLIAHIIGGRTEDYSYFLDRYGREVFAIVARVIPSQLDAEEVAQDAFVKAFCNLGSFCGKSSFSTWICRIAYNCAISYARKKKSQLVSFDEDEKLLATVTDEMADEALSAMDDQRVALLQKALEMLAPDERTLISLFYFEERTLNDIAYILSLKQNNVATKLCRVRKKLYLMIKRLEHGQEV